MMPPKSAAVFAFMLVCLGAGGGFLRAATVTADFVTGEGTNGWTFADDGYDPVYGRKFSDGDSATSPLYDEFVTNLMLTTHGVNNYGIATNPPAFIVWAGTSADSLVAVGTNWFNSGSTAVWSFAFASNLEYRVFRVAYYLGTAKGTFRLLSVAAIDGAPAPPPDPVPTVLETVPLSSGDYFQDFDFLAGLEDFGNPWTNCVSPLRYWQAYVGTDAVVRVSQNPGTTQYAGLYVLYSNTPASSSARALGSYAAGDKDVVYGLAFSNDTPVAQSRFAVSFRAAQWSNRNKIARTLVFQHLVTNALVGIDAPGGWVTDSGLSYTTPFTTSDAEYSSASAMEALVLPVVLQPGGLLVLRWFDEDPADGDGSDAMTGIDDFSLSWSPLRAPVPGFSIHIR